jgi:2,3-bisphosphoglycerate-dependent phosphoglycerate mutase
LIVAHGNTLRGLIKYTERIPDEDIADLDIPTGVPVIYELEDDMRPVRRYYLEEKDTTGKVSG